MAVAYPIVSWGNGTSVYEVNVRQYTPEGTLQAFRQHIPRLKEMGIKILWFMPLTPVSTEKRQGTLGSYYAAQCYTKICDNYGSEEDFKSIVKTAHQYGLKVMIDWVANHTGCDHHWVKEHPEWYKKDIHGNFIEEHGWVDVIDLDYNNHAMRKEMIASMQHWIKTFDIDGFRCDMAHLVPLDFWLEARNECDAIKPLFWLAECEEMHYHEAFDATYSWQWMHASARAAKNEISWKEAVGVLHHYAHYPVGARKLLFTSNHDENTWNGTEYEKYDSRATALAVISCTFPGIPLVYSGQELPNQKRLPFFEKDTIEWTEHPALHAFYQKLLVLRESNMALKESASVLFLHTGNDNVVAYLCRRQQDKVLVIANLGKEYAQVQIKHPVLKGNYKNLFSNEAILLNQSWNIHLGEGAYEVLYYTDENRIY